MLNNFVPYEQTLALKELGFDEPCILLYRGLDIQPVCQMGHELKTQKNSDYNDSTNYWLTVPTYQQAFKWFRDKHNLYLGICHDINNKFNCWANNGDLLVMDSYRWFSTYEEAESHSLNCLIEKLKNDTKQ